MRECLVEIIVAGTLQQSYPVFAPSIFEGAENEGTAAVVLNVVSQILSGDVGRATLIWALDREPRAVILVVLWDNM